VYLTTGKTAWQLPLPKNPIPSLFSALRASAEGRTDSPL